MTYNIAGLLADIEARLASNPATTLNEIAADSGVHRQTLERAISEATGLTFRELREESAAS